MFAFGDHHLKIRRWLPKERRQAFDMTQEFGRAALVHPQPADVAWHLVVITAVWAMLNDGQPEFGKIHENDYAKIKTLNHKAQRRLGRESSKSFAVLVDLSEQGAIPLSYKDELYRLQIIALMPR